MIRIACDVHTHTLFSRHAYSTLEENVHAASAKNLELLGVTDHFSCMLFDQQTLKNFQYFINMSAWPKEWRGIRLLHGCEADIVVASADPLAASAAIHVTVEKLNLAEATCEIDGGSTYTGSEQPVAVELTADGAALTQGVHYTLTPERVTNAGAYSPPTRGLRKQRHEPRPAGTRDKLLGTVDFPEELVACSSAERFLSLLP